jgi:dCTP deaminase
MVGSFLQKIRDQFGADPGCNRSILIGDEIRQLLVDRTIFIEPFPAKITECSVDVRLDNLFGSFVSTGDPALDPAAESNALQFEDISFFSRPFYIQPGTFILAQTFEYVAIPRTLVASLDGRSSMGRRGLVIHATAGWVDPGFEGHITLELANLGVMPLALYPGMRIGRLVFHRVAESSAYSGKYQRQYRIRGPDPDTDCQRIRDHAAAIKQGLLPKAVQAVAG